MIMLSFHGFYDLNPYLMYSNTLQNNPVPTARKNPWNHYQLPISGSYGARLVHLVRLVRLSACPGLRQAGYCQGGGRFGGVRHPGQQRVYR